MTPESCRNGIQHSIAEIDEDLTRLIPEYRKYTYAPRADAEVPQVNELLAYRNMLVEMLGAITINNMELQLENGA